MTRQEALMQVNSASFAVHEAVLFLDTHPNNTAAMEFYQKWNRKRRQVVADYERAYGPLTAHHVDDCDDWTWLQGPWPWEIDSSKSSRGCFATSVEKEESKHVDL